MSIWVRNNTAATIPRGQAVYSDGVAGGLPRVALARADALSTMPCIGVTLEPIDASQDGRIGTLETVLNMDTSSFALADLLYVSASSAGALTATVPASPNIVQRVGRVTAVDSRDGRLNLLIEQATFARDGSFDIIGTSPELRFSDTAQAAPAGRFRFQDTGNILYLQKSLTGSFTTTMNAWYVAGVASPITTFRGEIDFGVSNTDTADVRFAQSATLRTAATSGNLSFQGLNSTSVVTTVAQLASQTDPTGADFPSWVFINRPLFLSDIDFYFSSPTAARLIRMTDPSGTNIAGQGITLRPQIATGNAATGTFTVQTGIVGASGTVLQVVATAMSISPTTMVVNLNNAAQLSWTDGAFALQKATAITTPAATNLTLNPLTTGALILQSGGTEFLRLNNTGIGFFAVTPVARQTSGANLTNSVTAGGVNDTIANYTDLVTYGNDATTIRNDIYQLARQLKQVNDALRLYGLLT